MLLTDVSGKKCLLLERHETTRRVLKEFCQSLHLDVTLADLEQPAELKKRRGEFDLAIVDATLPTAAHAMASLKDSKIKIACLAKSLSTVPEEAKKLADTSIIKREDTVAPPQIS